MIHNRMFQGDLVLAALLIVGCGGSIDLAKLKETSGDAGGRPHQAGGSGLENMGGAAAAGAPASGGRNGMVGGGDQGGGAHGGEPGTEPGVECQRDDDCTECTTPTDPAISGCYVPCCGSEAMSATSCQTNWGNFRMLCPNMFCTADCNPKPPAQCVNGSCIHAQ